MRQSPTPIAPGLTPPAVTVHRVRETIESFSAWRAQSCSQPLFRLSRTNLIINPRRRSITIDGASSFQILAVSLGATLELKNLIVTHGKSDQGGAILNDGHLDVADSTFFSVNQAMSGGGAIFQEGSGNAAIRRSVFMGNALLSIGNGAAIYQGSTGALTITETTFSNNATQPDGGLGGAIEQDGTGDVMISNSLFTENGSCPGGAIFKEGAGTLVVTRTTFSGNNSGDSSGGAINGTGVIKISQSTFSGNAAIAAGGAISTFGLDSELTVVNSTFSGNTAFNGGGISNEGALVVSNSTFSFNGDWGISASVISTVSNSILFSNSRGNCRHSIGNGGYNISDDNSCAFGTSTGANGQIIGDKVAPLLDANGLQDNGGPTQTIALQPKSPAIDAVPIVLCPPIDQRGYKRPDPEDRGSLRKGQVWRVTSVPLNTAPGHAVDVPLSSRNRNQECQPSITMPMGRLSPF